MIEREMGNRGSKSVTSLYINKQQTVKEQRVDGSWCNEKRLHLRCTLLGFEINRLVKIPSNQIIPSRFYTNTNNIHFKIDSLPIIIPLFVTGWFFLFI